MTEGAPSSLRATTRLASSDDETLTASRDGLAAQPDDLAAAPDDSAAVTAALLAEEVMRTRAFMGISSALAVVGGAAMFFVDGDDLIRRLYVAVCCGLVAASAWFYLHTEDPSRYTIGKGLAVVTLCNVAALVAVLYYGVFSPASMILLLPIFYFGQARSLGAASAACLSGAAAVAVASALFAWGVFDDPGLVRATELTPFGLGLYAALIQTVFAAAFAFARQSQSSTTTAVRGLERALQALQQKAAQLEEAHEELERARAGQQKGRMSGQRLGRWRLGALLGRGGMGDVYVGHPDGGGERAAIKLLHPTAAPERDAALFEREARVMSSLRSPHVVTVFEVGLHPEIFIAMEVLEGEDLGARLRRQPRLPVDDVALLVDHAARALEEARAAGIVHRDIKPSNLFFSDNDGAWKVLDFGVSKLEGHDSTLTRDAVMGTPNHMSPEQVRADPIDHRSDVFSLASVAYRALVGRRPFVGANWHAVMLAVSELQPPDPRAWVSLPSDVELVLALGLAKDPRIRFQRALDLARAFDLAAIGALPPPLRERGQRLLAADPWSSPDLHSGDGGARA